MANHTNHDPNQLAGARDASVRARRAKAQVREARKLYAAGWRLTPPSRHVVSDAQTRQYDEFRAFVMEQDALCLEMEI